MTQSFFVSFFVSISMYRMSISNEPLWNHQYNVCSFIELNVVKNLPAKTVHDGRAVTILLCSRIKIISLFRGEGNCN